MGFDSSMLGLSADAGQQLMPQGLGQQTGASFQTLVQGWPNEGPVAAKIRQMEGAPGNARNDILDKEGPPPGFPEEQRLVAILGTHMQVASATAEVESLVAGTGSGGGAQMGQSAMG